MYMYVYFSLLSAECFVYLLETRKSHRTQKMGEVSLYFRESNPKGFINVHNCPYMMKSALRNQS